MEDVGESGLGDIGLTVDALLGMFKGRWSSNGREAFGQSKSIKDVVVPYDSFV